MSKSLGNVISIFEDEEIIRKQVMSTYTDPTRIHASDPGHAEGNMVFTYLDFFWRIKLKYDELKKAYREGKVSDIEVKITYMNRLLKYFANARQTYQELVANPDGRQEIFEDGAGESPGGCRGDNGRGTGSGGVGKPIFKSDQFTNPTNG